MKTIISFLAALAAFSAIPALASIGDHEEDVFSTPKGDLTVIFLGHASLLFKFDGKVIHVDPFGKVADYSGLPKADLVLVTHEHYDHLDPKALDLISKPGTIVVASRSCSGLVKGAIIMANGDSKEIEGIMVEAVPAYNIEHRRSDGTPFHPAGYGNGYVITFGGKRIYIAGDTEDVPEMMKLRNIDMAFLPMNVPYTMSPEMTAHAAKTIRPVVLYPYHYGDTDPRKLTALLKDQKGIEVRIRKLS